MTAARLLAAIPILASSLILNAAPVHLDFIHEIAGTPIFGGSIRNIALTAPYMHDGRFATLEEVIDH